MGRDLDDCVQQIIVRSARQLMVLMIETMHRNINRGLNVLPIRVLGTHVGLALEDGRLSIGVHNQYHYMDPPLHAQGGMCAAIRK